MEKEVLSYETLDSSNRQLPTLLHTLSVPKGQTVLSPASFPTSSDSLFLFFLRGLLPTPPACLTSSWHINAFNENLICSMGMEVRHRNKQLGQVQ